MVLQELQAMVEASLFLVPYGAAEPAVAEISGLREGAGWRFWQVPGGKPQLWRPCHLQ